MPRECAGLPGEQEDGFITVIAGLPRSGTSMVMKMLSDAGLPVLSDGVREADADNPRRYFEYEATKRLGRDASWLEHAVGKGVKIVIQLLPHLPSAYRYRIIVIERDLHEVLESQRTMLARHGATGARLPPEQLSRAFELQVGAVKAWLAQQVNVATLCVRVPRTS